MTSVGVYLRRRGRGKNVVLCIKGVFVVRNWKDLDPTNRYGGLNVYLGKTSNEGATWMLWWAQGATCNAHPSVVVVMVGP